MIELLREPGDGLAMPGSTFRPVVRIAARSAGDELASATLGWAEVFERQPLEHLVGRLSWADDIAPVRDAVAAAVAEVPAGGPVHLLTWLDERTTQRRRVAEDCGFALFQEKVGFWWSAEDRQVDAASRIGVAPMSNVGREPIAAVMRLCAGEILDRTDRAMIARCGVDRWVREFLDTHADGADRRTWLLGTDPAGTPVGFIGLSARDDNSATIVHIGVIPGRRGRSYGRDLLTAAKAVARTQGWSGLRALVDVVNEPMLTTMRRTGFAATSWHKWHYSRTA